MSESMEHGQQGGNGPDPTERTGNPVVDAVLDSLEGLDTRPVEEHVTVFEAAHEQLRAALSDAGSPPSPSAPGR